MRNPTRSNALSFALVLTSLGLAAAAGCSGGVQSDGAVKAPQNASDHPQAGRCEAGGSALKPVGGVEQSSPIALGTFSEGPLKDKTIAFIADEDDKSVLVVDVDSKKEISRQKLEGAPGQLMVMADGRLMVTVRGSNQLAVLHPATDGSLAPGCSVATSAEPIALATTPDAKTILLTAGWGRALEAYDGASLSKKAKVPLSREPRTVVVDDDGKFAYVSHAVGGKTSIVDLGNMKAAQPIKYLVNPNLADDESQDRPFSLTSAVNGAVGDGEKPIPGRFGTKMGCQGFPMVKSTEPKGRILAPQILVDPGDPENRAQGYGDANQPTEVANVAVIDAGTRRLVNASVGTVPDRRFFGGDPREPQAGECLLPRSAAVDTQSSTLLVTCLGIDSVVAYDASSANPVTVEKARWDVGSGPTGIAVDGGKRRAVVWSQFERSVEIINLDAMGDEAKTKKHDRVAIKPMTEAMPLAFVLGRQIFHAIGDARISNDGRACASCHPDGRDDAITWATPEGPRRTIMLAGRLAGTEPMAWNGTSKDLRDHLSHTFERLNGQGLRNVELEALVSYIEGLPTPPREAEDATLVAKGKELFHSDATECGHCHTGGGTDNKTHELGSKVKADRKAGFNTPSLSYLSGRGQFFHDGRFETLRDVLVGADGMMGHTKHLKPQELDALEAYLRSL